ncbi:MAG TPA: hypothetical protein VE641_16875 [Chthoniobacterales bacterium]|jgi:hypothetical protein|nr:hypothetical protein [Chthoniobacterales bacterium]
MTAQENSCSPATLLAPGALGIRGSWTIPLKNHCAIERVVSELYTPVYRFALVLAESETEAADLTQETFLILCQQYKQVREPEKLSLGYLLLSAECFSGRCGNDKYAPKSNSTQSFRSPLSIRPGRDLSMPAPF